MNNSVLVKNQIVRVRAANTSDEWTKAIVQVVSSNGKSVGLVLLDGMVRAGTGFFMLGVLPLMVDYEKETVTGLEGTEYELEHSNEMWKMSERKGE